PSLLSSLSPPPTPPSPLSLHDALPISSAHCAMKASSATVATERPTITQDHHPPKSAIRCTSARGRIERKPQPTTNSADINRSCQDRKSTRLNSSHGSISYAVFCLKKKK